MKYLIITVLSLTVSNVYAQAEMKKVCHDEEKNGKTVQVCKTIKIHKKLEGTEVPVKK
jgi:beta-lactamase class D